jgi:WS/DGAT/MGAT family acyltransferase
MGSVKLTGPSPRMTPLDAGFLYLERPHTPLHIGCVALLDGAITRAEVVRHLESRIPRVRRYAQRAVRAPLSLAHPSWEDDPDFDVRNHVFRWSVPAPAGEHDMHELVETLLSQPLARSRPLWEMHVLEGVDGERTALFHKVHHSMIDGVSGAGLLDVLLDANPFAGTDPEPTMGLQADAPLGATSRLGGALAASLGRPVACAARMTAALLRPSRVRQLRGCLREAASRALDLASHARPSLPWSGAIGFRRRLAFTRLPMDEIQRIRHETGATVNDVVLTILAGGLRRYLHSAGVRVERPVVAVVPVSTRTAERARSPSRPRARSNGWPPRATSRCVSSSKSASAA